MPDFKDLIRSYGAGRRLIALAMLLSALLAGPARADCLALRNLPDIITEVEHMARLTDNSAIAASGARLAVYRQQINKNTMYQMLEPQGMEFSLPDIMRLKVKLGVLSQFAVKEGLQKTYVYMRGSDFLRSYDPVRSLVLHHCAAPSLGNQIAGLSSALPGLGGEIAVSNPVPNGDAGDAGKRAVTPPRKISTGETILGAGTGSVILIGLAAAWLGHKQRRWRRRSKRHPCDIAVSLKAGAHLSGCTAVDLSQTGANLEIDAELNADDRVTIDFGELSRKATIIWSNSKYAGVSFEQPLRRAEFVATLDRSTLDIDAFRHPAKRKATPQRASLETVWARLSAALASAFTQQRQ